MLITKACKDDPIDEYEAFMNAAANRADSTHQEVQQHILEAFRGPDKAEALKEEIKKIKQSTRKDITAISIQLI